VAANTYDPMWQVTPHSSDMEYHKEKYTPQLFKQKKTKNGGSGCQCLITVLEVVLAAEHAHNLCSPFI